MKTALSRLFVSLLSLVASVLELGTALVRLVTALVLRAAAAVRPRAEAVQAPQEARPRLRVVPQRADGATRLTTALVGLGWSAPAVRRFVDSVGDRVDREPIEALLKEGIAKLAA
jgi:Holliday junction resolvasome RuvABC DNA-binding subunit